ncbi:pentapeptide repeat-containing protein [Nodularia sp. NIES-3585]|uniref:pentapeptide repeat-containing protein n=1 Tax=Nodularia sp. NIES-3585 TaxID=1973477 RepID=UPI000B5C4D93|nr:pentapeptide repeat-containing protein [Nodularia sp. NIES-3585]GAX38853.1 pentapeptide repeat-containing protein [Nodularia sp. NIES-3585]
MFQDYSHQNLRGRSFKGQDLAGANFSYADIRGADFSGANLVCANFTCAKAGLQKRWVMFLIILLWLWSGLLGVYWFIYGYLVSRIFDGAKLGNQIAGWVSLSILIAFFLLTIHRGVKKSSEMVWLILVLTLGLAIPFAYGGILAICCGVIGILTSCFAFIGVFAFIFSKAGSTALTITSFVAGALALFNIYVGWRALKGDEKYLLIGNIAVLIAATRSTSFCNADLTNANFTKAWLKGANFKNAVLISTHWFNVKMLDRVCPGNTYLQNIQLHQLLIRGQGQNMSLDRQDIRGVNLKGANLKDASFIGTDLSGANLQNADLTRAKLVQTQLDATDFTGATLTGAYIQDWGITTDTKFDGVRCEYVYMRLPTQDNPDPHRKPDNRQETFADGEFGDFIKPIFDTLDLYHSQGVDPRAIAISFKQLAENYPDAELEIVAMEKRGQDKFWHGAKTAITADKSELSAKYFDSYNQLKNLPDREIKLLLAEKENQIRRLENMIMTALERPNFYSNVEQVGFMTNNPGGFSIGGSVGGNVNNVQGDNNRAVQGDNNQDVLGDNNRVTQQNQVGADAAESLTKEDVFKLLAELENLIQRAELPADTKEEVVEDLSAAKKATEKEKPNKQRALDRLTSVAETLEKTTKTVDSGKQLWTTAKPIIVKIATWLGAAAGSHLLGL